MQPDSRFSSLIRNGHLLLPKLEILSVRKCSKDKCKQFLAAKCCRNFPLWHALVFFHWYCQFVMHLSLLDHVIKSELDEVYLRSRNRTNKGFTLPLHNKEVFMSQA